MARAKKSKVKVSELEGQPDPRAPLDSAGLLSACQGVLARLEADLLERAKSSPAVTRALEARYQAEKAAERTAESFAGWTALPHIILSTTRESIYLATARPPFFSSGPMSRA